MNYQRTPEWEQEVRTLTSGRGVDCVIEIGGAGTLARSIRSLARGGKVCLIGFLAGRDGDTNPTPLMMVGGSLHGIFVGDREMFEEMNRAIAVNRPEARHRSESFRSTRRRPHISTRRRARLLARSSFAV